MHGSSWDFILMTLYNYVKCGYIRMAKTPLCTCRGGHMRFYMHG